MNSSHTGVVIVIDGYPNPIALHNCLPYSQITLSQFVSESPFFLISPSMLDFDNYLQFLSSQRPTLASGRMKLLSSKIYFVRSQLFEFGLKLKYIIHFDTQNTSP